MMKKNALCIFVSLLIAADLMFAQGQLPGGISPWNEFKSMSGDIVLLKNHGKLLPLDNRPITSIALIGPEIHSPGLAAKAKQAPDSHSFISPYKGIAEYLGDSIDIYTAYGVNMVNDVVRLDSSYVYVGQGVHGYAVKYYDHAEAEGIPIKSDVDKYIDHYWEQLPFFGADTVFSMSWSATLIPEHGPVKAKLIHSGACRLYLDGKLMIDNWKAGPVRIDSAWLNIKKGQSYNLKIEFFSKQGPAVIKFGFDYLESNMIYTAVEKAKRADVAIVIAGQAAVFQNDGNLSPAYQMPAQSKLIRAVLGANPNTIVVLQTEAAVDIETWAFDVPAIIQAWMPRQQSGREIANVLFGKENPAGKLPFRWTMNENQNFATRFAFGHGLSYTTFGIGKLLIWPLRDSCGWVATVEIRNMDKRTGTETLQLYARQKEHLYADPVSELKAFKKISLWPEQKKVVVIPLPCEAFMYFDEETGQWTFGSGIYEILVGVSEEDMKLRKILEVKPEYINIK
ncbi:MAG: glycoside hydrolase family 3 C-terminal domain-containing protein [Bacteroidales bacterium]|nr:glycoside hydrolase family 3 C-terminal domain-containing protein [Bacteroidales bacterium]